MEADWGSWPVRSWRARQRCLVVLLTDLSPAALTAGLLPRIGLLSARYRLLIGAVSDPRVAQLAAGRGNAEAVYAAGAAARAQAGGPGSARCCAAAGWRSWTPRRTGCPRPWPTPTWRLKASGQL